MRLFKRRQTASCQFNRMNIARTIYSTVINQCNREAIYKRDYDNLPKIAAKSAVEFADALIEELKNTKKQ